MMKTKVAFLFTMIVFGISMKPKTPVPPVEICGARNLTTQNGEIVEYDVFYTVAGIYVKAGEATFSNRVEKLNGKPVFHIVADGKTNEKYDWIFKVRDRYESFIDTATMEPLKFIRNVNEGGH